MTAPVGGFLRVLVALDQRVREGERVAVVSNLNGDPVADVPAPATGQVIAFTATPPVKAGEPVVAVGILRPRR